MQRIWDNSQARAASPAVLLDRVFGQIEFQGSGPGTAEASSDSWWNRHSDTRYGRGPWADNYRGGRVHEPAGH
jgi:hypothetical protein